MNKSITISIAKNNEQQEIITASFKGDELTSPEQQAILWLREQEQDPLDNKEGE